MRHIILWYNPCSYETVSCAVCRAGFAVFLEDRGFIYMLQSVTNKLCARGKEHRGRGRELHRNNFT